MLILYILHYISHNAIPTEVYIAHQNSHINASLQSSTSSIYSVLSFGPLYGLLPLYIIFILLLSAMVNN